MADELSSPSVVTFTMLEHDRPSEAAAAEMHDAVEFDRTLAWHEVPPLAHASLQL